MNDENFDSEEPSAAFLGSSSSAKTMADGTLRITIDLSPADAIGAFTAFGKPGSAVAIARITDKAAVEAERPTRVKGPFGELAKKLVQSGFFRSPEVWAGIGTDEEYLEWVKHKPSAISGEFSEFHDTGEQYCIPAHIRRVQYGSGTAEKPPYCAIPLTNAEHQQTHQHGDSSLRPEEWWDKQRIKYVSKWAFETLKGKMGYDSYTDMAPHRLVDWASQRELIQYLPLAYINAEKTATETHEEESEA
ncbi:MAG: hypothetical protein OEQ39_04180 [Gammaproteobacteria bacterium]|nr:hypothetical protein [Gammaproteobacteria bacterium]MDH3466190.1 hypothetical protein [Gammaproteobacteria bacterium]